MVGIFGHCIIISNPLWPGRVEETVWAIAAAKRAGSSFRLHIYVFHTHRQYFIQLPLVSHFVIP